MSAEKHHDVFSSMSQIGQALRGDGPPADAAGFAGMTWPVTSQSKRWRIAARRCLTVGAERSGPSCSMVAATCRGLMSAIDATSARWRQARNSRVAWA